METELTPQQIKSQEEFREFISQFVPYADQYDKDEYRPPEVMEKIAAIGYVTEYWR